MPHDAEIRRRVEQACVDFERDLRAFLIGMLRDVHLVDEVFQRSVVKAIEAAADVRSETIRGWLFQIALNEARQVKRTQSRQGRLHQAVWESGVTPEWVEGSDGLSQLLGEETRQSVAVALKKLEPKYREVVTRRIQQGQTFAQIAAEMEKPLGTVLTWMRRAILQLRDMSEIREMNDG